MGKKSRAKTRKPETPLVGATAGATVAATEPGTTLVRDDSPRATIFIIAALIVLTLAVYARVGSFQFLTYDDNVYVTTNSNVQRGLTMEGLRWALTSFTVTWHPVTWATLMADVEFFGPGAGPHHLVNVAFHLASVILLFLLLQRMTAQRWRSAIVAAIFAIHPLHVESVAWIAERKDVLCAFFLLLTVWFYVSWTRNRSAIAYAAMLVAFILGLGSKQMIVTLPFALLLLDYWPLHRLDFRDRPLMVRRLVEKIPLFALVISGIALAIVGQREVKAFVTTTSLPMTTRIANAVHTYATYLGKTFVPAPLALPYPYQALSIASLTAAALVLLGVTFFVLVNRERRYLFTGWFWFVGTLVPVIGLVQIGSQSMADRYTYIPHIGLLTAIVWLAADIAAKWKMERVAAAIAGIAVIALAYAASSYAAMWRDSETLFRHDLAVTRNNHVAHSNLGSALVDQQRFAEAVEQFRAALAIQPDDANALTKLAAIQLKSGNRAEAVALLERAVKVEPMLRTEGQLALAKGDTAKAIEEYRLAVKEDPYLADVHVDLAAALALAGKNEEALAEDRAALKLDPSHYDAHMNVGALLSRMNRNEEALRDFQLAAQARPSSPEPHVYLALLDLSMGRKTDALAEARIAAQTDRAASNLLLTNALRLPAKETNLDDFIAFLEKK